MAYNNPNSKLQRAVFVFLIAQGKASVNDTYVADFSGTRSLPNPSIIT